MPWPVYLALKQLFPTGRVSFFTLISVLGVGLGVALMLVSTSVMGGFGHQIKRMIIDTQGEVQVKARGLIDPDAGVEKVLAAEPDAQHRDQREKRHPPGREKLLEGEIDRPGHWTKAERTE
jgi:lipoprotein-releasing system permease protein